METQAQESEFFVANEPKGKENDIVLCNGKLYYIKTITKIEYTKEQKSQAISEVKRLRKNSLEPEKINSNLYNYRYELHGIQENFAEWQLTFGIENINKKLTMKVEENQRLSNLIGEIKELICE